MMKLYGVPAAPNPTKVFLYLAEREALGATFAVKDRFTLTHLRQCPWGFSAEELTRAIETRDYLDLEFWRRASHGLMGS